MSNGFIHVAIPALLCILLGWNLLRSGWQGYSQPAASRKRRNNRDKATRVFYLISGAVTLAIGIGAILVDLLLRLVSR
jgi:hypothetical protein